MRKLATKSKKLIAVLVAAFVLTVAGAAVSSATATAAPGASGIGYVDFRLLVAQHPDAAAAQQTIQAAIEQADKDFKEKSANMSDQDKQKLYTQMRQELDAKATSLMVAVEDKVVAAVKEIADKKGLSIVIDKSVAIYGGEDITAEVGKKLSGK